jgi:hypothetical protein
MTATAAPAAVPAWNALLERGERVKQAQPVASQWDEEA